MTRPMTSLAQDSAAPAPEPQWLLPSERAAWLSLVGVVTKLPLALDQQLQREAGITFYDYMVMAVLSEQENRTLRMSEVATITNGSLSRLSHVVSRLEKQGWISRQTCPLDGRYTNATLTADGYAKVVDTAPGHVRRVRELVIDALAPPELDQLRQAGDAIMARVDPQNTCKEVS